MVRPAPVPQQGEPALELPVVLPTQREQAGESGPCASRAAPPIARAAARPRRSADAAGLGDRFQARRDIDRIAHQVVAAFHDVAEIDADAQNELIVRSGLVVGRAHRFLDFQGGADGLDRAREFRQEPVAGQLEDASAMVPHQRLGGGHAGAEEAERVFLVARRHGAEADDVDVHDRGQAPDEVGFRHGDRLADPPNAGHRSEAPGGPCLCRRPLRRPICMHSKAPRYWDDYEIGQRFDLGSTSFTADEIVDFARQYDPQGFHVDAGAARQSMFGGLIASGWHVTAKLMRLFVDNYVDQRTALGSPGVDEVRWLKPVRPGATLNAGVDCAGKVPSKSRPEMGIVHEHWRATNQKGELVMTLKGTNMVRRRPA